METEGSQEMRGSSMGEGWMGGEGKRRTFHRRDGVRVHVVEARVRRVGALGRRACGAGLEFAAGGSDGFGGGVGGAFILHGVSRPVHWIYTPLSLVLSFWGGVWLRTCSALVVRRCRDDDRVPRGGERGVEGADVELCPAVVVGEEDVCGRGEEGEDG